MQRLKRVRFHRALAAAALAVFLTAGLAVLPAGPASSAATISTSGGTISLSAENEPLREVLLALGKQLGISVVVASEVQGRVSVSLHDVTLDQALAALTADTSYIYQHSHGVVYVGLPPKPKSAAASPSSTPGTGPAVLSVTVINAERAAAVLSRLYPHAQISVDHAANAVIVVAKPDEVQAMRAVLQGLDIQNPTRPTTEVIQLHTTDPKTVAQRLQLLYPNVRLTNGPNKTIIVVAPPLEMAQIMPDVDNQ